MSEKQPLTVAIAKTGYLALYMSNESFFNNQIVKRQLKAGFAYKDAVYTHVETIGIKHDGIRYSINVNFPKTKKIDMFKHHKGRYVKILRFKNEHYEKWGRSKVSWWAASKCNKKYDVFGVLAFVFKWMKQNNRLWFCSESSADDIKTFYPRCFPMPADKVMPADFSASNQFEVVAEGIIQ